MTEEERIKSSRTESTSQANAMSATLPSPVGTDCRDIRHPEPGGSLPCHTVHSVGT